MKPLTMKDRLLEDLADARAIGESEEILRILNILSSHGSFLEDAVLAEKKEPVKKIEVSDAGWYQNADGKLFHYDGVVWDEVPSEKQGDLEFLG